MTARGIGVVLASAALLAACASVRSGPPAYRGQWPVAGVAGTRSVALVVVGRGSSEQYAHAIGPVFERWRGETERAWRESALFSSVRLGLGAADLSAEVELVATVDDMQWLNVVSAGTLFVLPNVVTHEIALDARITDGDARTLDRVRLVGTHRTWFHLLLLPVTPLAGTERVTPGIVYDLNRLALRELHARGTL